MPRTVRERADVVPALVEVFRDYGYDGASLAVIGKRTGLGKGSLYNFFPGGKQEMAEAALAHIDDWFGQNVFRPLCDLPDPRAGIKAMLDGVETYFRGGQRACLVGALALAHSRDLFAERIRAYFRVWQDNLAGALKRLGDEPSRAGIRAEEALALIQGALVLSLAHDDTAPFRHAMDRLGNELLAR